jgi:hypothetical protein
MLSSGLSFGGGPALGHERGAGPAPVIHERRGSLTLPWAVALGNEGIDRGNAAVEVLPPAEN